MTMYELTHLALTESRFEEQLDIGRIEASANLALRWPIDEFYISVDSSASI